ncbi:hypothetical protein [Ornithinibacillus californiensis]|uniref:hypothetical protein n=1 Tax=Ornithinibacillus californiensis TaxID=161536 RepID=UPI00064DF6A7|nr:hypothetical protein [Ornithinibacillus californiensis]
MYVQSLQTRKPIRISRSVYSMEELQKIAIYAERGGARILSITPSFHGSRLTVSLELDGSKRQF